MDNLSAIDYLCFFGVFLGLVAGYWVFRLSLHFGGLVGTLFKVFSIVIAIDSAKSAILSLQIIEVLSDSVAFASTRILRAISLSLALFAAVWAFRRIEAEEKGQISGAPEESTRGKGRKK